MNQFQEFITKLIVDADTIDDIGENKYDVFVGKLGSIPGETKIHIGVTIKLYALNIQEFFNDYSCYLHLVDKVSLSRFGGDELKLTIRVT